MKNKILTMLTLVTAIVALSSCEKELMTFQGEDCLYFDVRRGAKWIEPRKWARWNYSEVTFGNILSNDTTLSLKISATGDVKDYDRPFTVIVRKDSTDLEENTEYEPLEQQYAIKAGERNTIVNVTFHRTARMEGDTLKLQLEILPNKYFSLNFNKYGDYPDTYDADNPVREFNHNTNARFHNLFVDDVLVQPTGWFGTETGGLFGKFSAKKYKYIMEVTGTNIFDFTNEKMPIGRATAISQQVARELIKRAQAKDPVLDEDGTMMWVSYVTTLGGKEAWYAYTKPETYYKYR